jgi:hypothetical protein
MDNLGMRENPRRTGEQNVGKVSEADARKVNRKPQIWNPPPAERVAINRFSQETGRGASGAEKVAPNAAAADSLASIFYAARGKTKESSGESAAMLGDPVAQRAGGERLFREGSMLFDVAAAREHNTKLITENLRHARQLLRDVQATLAAGGVLESPADSYIDERREEAINALHGLDLPVLLAGAGIDSVLRRDIQDKVEFLSNPPKYRIAGTSAVSELLTDLDAEISDLLRNPEWKSPVWRARAEFVLGLAGRFFRAIGIALAAAAGSVFAVGEAQSAPDDVKAVTSCLITAGCLMLQRDLPALWRQPDLSHYLYVADQGLHNKMDRLRGTLSNYQPESSEYATSIAAAVFAVEQDAYWAQCLARAAEDWPDARDYCADIAKILKTCQEIKRARTDANAAYLEELAAQLKRDARNYRVPGDLQLRPEARLRLAARILTQVTPEKTMRPGINPTEGEGAQRPLPVPDPTEDSGGGTQDNAKIDGITNRTTSATVHAAVATCEAPQSETNRPARTPAEAMERLLQAKSSGVNSRSDAKQAPGPLD